MKTILFLLIGISMTMTVYSNPLLEKFATPFGVPAFNKFKTSDYMPAFKEAIKMNEKEIEAIINNKETPNFKNTIEVLDNAGQALNQVATIFYNLNSVITDDEMMKIAEESSPLLSAHSDNISMNKELFKRIKYVYEHQKSENLTKEQQRLLDDNYRGFVRNGAELDDKKQAKMRELNERLSLLTLKFGQNVLKETNSYQLVIDNKKDLSGLPQGLIDAAADDAKARGLEGKWVFTLQNPSIMPFLQYADNRNLRKVLLDAYLNRGNNNNEFDNKEIIKEIANLRLERANLLGYKSHADFVLAENMAKTPAKVFDLLDKLWTPALNVSKQEAADMQKMINEEGGNFKLEPCDWRYYSEKVRKAKYDLNEEEIRPYFQLENVKKGIFELSKRLYGITFKEMTNLPKYHEDAVSYEVLENDGSHLGVIYMDFFPRDSKRGGAWMTNYREEYYANGEKVSPVVSIVLNFTKPTKDQPSLLTIDETETFFHEFGHALHGLFSNCQYLGVSGTNVSRDFVELPSQIMENWAFEPEMLALYAKHYKTNEVIPAKLVEKIKAASRFGQGFATTEYLAASYLDLFYHIIEKPLTEDIDKFEANKLGKLGLISEIPPRYRSTYFRHTFSGGYDAGYYAYIWAGVLDSDAFQDFKENGIFDKKTATSFRKNILEKGNSEDPMDLYIRFRGQEPSIKPLLEKRGLN
ncbi:MAG: peptidase M3 [Ignavibacteria bacterium GWF2_33_9]|nr:MAG: peptidase M3 [Ignavibacteria bacterium GWF2_33_9]